MKKKPTEACDLYDNDDYDCLCLTEKEFAKVGTKNQGGS